VVASAAMSKNAAEARHAPEPRPSFRPLYEQIKILLTQGLVAGEWKPGEAIPSEIDLAQRYQVSQGTVRKAIDALAAEHILVRRQGKGTFVASHNEPSHHFRFLRVLPDSGDLTPPHSVLVQLKRAKAAAEPARALGIRVGTPVHCIKRLLIFGGRPVVLDEMILSATRFPGITAARLEEHRVSIYQFYENVFGVRMIRAEERLRAVAASEFAAAQLQVEPGTPLLCVDRIAFTYGDKPVEWRRGLCVTEGYSYFNELS
jgi:GntR family transcriptional regulator